MADISMCEGTGCPRKMQCYRHTAPVSQYRQAYFTTVPVKPDGSCDHFWDNKEYGGGGPFDDD